MELAFFTPEGADGTTLNVHEIASIRPTGYNSVAVRLIGAETKNDEITIQRPPLEPGDAVVFEGIDGETHTGTWQKLPDDYRERPFTTEGVLLPDGTYAINAYAMFQLHRMADPPLIDVINEQLAALPPKLAPAPSIESFLGD